MTTPARTGLHALALALLLGGFVVAQVRGAQDAPPAAPALERLSLLDRWLTPDVIIGGVLVLLYVGELRGDLKRIKADQAAMRKQLHDDYLTKELADARFVKKADR